MLKTGVSPFCSFESVFSLTPVQKVAPYCLVPSTASSQLEDMPHFCPSFCSLCPQNHDPESLGTGVSPWLVHTTGKPFPHPKNYLPSTNPDPFVSPYSPWIHSESVCIMLQEEDQTCRKPSHKPWELNNANTDPSCLSLCKDPNPHTLPRVKWPKHSQKGGNHLSCNAWTHSFFNTAALPCSTLGI